MKTIQVIPKYSYSHKELKRFPDVQGNNVTVQYNQYHSIRNNTPTYTVIESGDSITSEHRFTGRILKNPYNNDIMFTLSFDTSSLYRCIVKTQVNSSDTLFNYTISLKNTFNVPTVQIKGIECKVYPVQKIKSNEVFSLRETGTILKPAVSNDIEALKSQLTTYNSRLYAFMRKSYLNSNGLVVVFFEQVIIGPDEPVKGLRYISGSSNQYSIDVVPSDRITIEPGDVLDLQVTFQEKP